MVSRIIDDINANLGKLQCHVLVFGSNNLWSGAFSVQSVINHFCMILEHLTSQEGVRVVFTSLVPSLRTGDSTKDIFKEFNSKLKVLHNTIKKKTLFGSFTKYLVKEENVNADMFENDLIHP